MACNRKDIVDAVLERLTDVNKCDEPVQLQVMKETLTPTGKDKTSNKNIDKDK